MAASPDAVWQIIRKNSSFLVKRNGHAFNSDPANLTNWNSFRQSGLTQKKAVKITPTEKGVVLATKISGKSRKPATQYSSVKLTKGFRQVSRSIKSSLNGSYYRPDLVTAALARWSQIYRTLKVQKKAKTPAAKPAAKVTPKVQKARKGKKRVAKRVKKN
eukprot:TRINITY_DN1175_c0_g1_i1.p1 TRINITY_DN1175_c0_g1~~TRINITY_DN1175_c0_g1_i1.p1  ORF type:complete len:160 (+),score=42.83 TRINITY_DN1175_c0_g1_i1:111-590(+)